MAQQIVSRKTAVPLISLTQNLLKGVCDLNSIVMALNWAIVSIIMQVGTFLQISIVCRLTDKHRR